VDTFNFYKTDSGHDLAIGDMIYVTEGDLQQAHGPIVNFTEGGNIVVFKPINIEGFNEDIQLKRGLIVKYFMQGDSVRIIEGKF
jgi:hypothetical protein